MELRIVRTFLTQHIGAREEVRATLCILGGVQRATTGLLMDMLSFNVNVSLV